MAVAASRRPNVANLAKSASTGWDLLAAITARDMRVRYQGTLLSYVWWIARPLALGAVLYFALGQVLKVRLGVDAPHYSIFLLSALFPWFWFSAGILQSAGSFTANAGLLKKVQFPKPILPLSAIFYNTVQFLLTLPVLIVFVLLAGIDPSLTWLVGIPMLLALQLLLMIGLGTLLATLDVFFKDLGPLLEIVMLLMFYMSPIIYPLDSVPDSFRPILLANPVAPLLEGWRELFLDGTLSVFSLWPSIVLTAVTLALGLGAFRTGEKHFADVL